MKEKLYFYDIMDLPINDELFPVVDEDRNEISRTALSICHDGKSKLFHPVNKSKP